MRRRESALDQLDRSLRATNVLSKDYRSTIIAYAHNVSYEAYENGIVEGRRRARLDARRRTARFQSMLERDKAWTARVIAGDREGGRKSSNGSPAYLERKRMKHHAERLRLRGLA